MPEVNKNIEIGHLSDAEKAELLAKLTAEKGVGSSVEVSKEGKTQPIVSISESTLTPEQQIAASTNIPTDVKPKPDVATTEPAAPLSVEAQNLQNLIDGKMSFED